MALTKEQIASRASKLRQQRGLEPKAQKFLEGGKFSDVLDILQAPQFAATGFLSGKGALKGVKERMTPGKALGLGTISGLIADIVLDPLNLLGVGGLTKAAKAGKLGKSTTLGAQVARGERNLLTFAGQNIIPGGRAAEVKLAEGITKGAEAVKRSPVGTVLEKFGVTPATGFRSLEEIELASGALKRAKQAGLKATGIEKAAMSKAIDFSRKIDSEIKSLIKKGAIKEADTIPLLKNIRSTALGEEAAKLPSALNKIAKEMGDVVKEQAAIRQSLKLPSLEGKALPLVPATESKEFLKTQRPPGTLKRLLGSTSKSELEGTHFKLGNTIVKQEGKSIQEIAKSGAKKKNFIDIGGNFFEIKKPLSQETNEFISNIIRAGGGKQLEINDIMKIANRERRLIDTQAFKELQELVKNSVKKTGVDEISLNKALKASGSPLKFSEDPVELVGELIARTGKSKAKRNFVTEVSEIGIPKPKGGIPDGWAESNLDELKGMIFPRPVIQHIDATSAAFSKIDDVNDFVKMYDKIQNTWKGLATFVNPAFHSRNFVSNLWQGFLGGVQNPKWYGKAGVIQKAVSKANKTGKPLKSLIGEADAKLWNEFLEEGIGNTGWIGADIEQALNQNQNIFFRAGGVVGQSIEDNAKLGMFLQRRAKGLTSAEAAAEARKYFFDYNDLTPFEKNIMKRVFPFYTWTRKNIPLQVAMLIQQPTKFSGIDKIKRAIEASVKGEPVDEQLLPGWMKDAYPIFLGTDKDNISKYFRLEGFLPAVDINRIGDPGDQFIQNLSPIIKSPFELATGEDFFRKREIQEFPGQTQNILGFNVPVKSAYFARQIRPIMELDGLFNEKMTVPERVQKLLAGFKLQKIDKRRQKNTFEYLKSREEGKIKAEMNRQRKAGNFSVIPGLNKELKNLEKEFQIP